MKGVTTSARNVGVRWISTTGDSLVSRVTATNYRRADGFHVGSWVFLGGGYYVTEEGGKASFGRVAAVATKVVAILLRVVGEVVLVTFLRVL